MNDARKIESQTEERQIISTDEAAHCGEKLIDSLRKLRRVGLEAVITEPSEAKEQFLSDIESKIRAFNELTIRSVHEGIGPTDVQIRDQISADIDAQFPLVDPFSLNKTPDH